MFAVRRAALPLFVIAVVGASSLAGGERAARGDETKPEPNANANAKEARSESVVGSQSAGAPAGLPSSSIVSISQDGKTVTCREQAAQSFLVRGNWFPRDPAKAKDGRKLLEDAIKYRTEKYGYFEGFGSPKWNAQPPKHFAKSTSFMGMTLQVHEKIIPALKCVEAALRANGAADQYHPRAAGGIRFKNTYRGVEVSNHVYGIAVDIEPDRNSCCGCVAPWPEHPLCKAKNKTVWERMAMPRSWVETFEKYGFYWLGHDVLQDTMHFEFLGDPEKILDAAP